MKITLTALLLTMTIVGCSSNKSSVQKQQKPTTNPVVAQKKTTSTPTSISRRTNRLPSDKSAKQYYAMGQKFWGQNNFTEALTWYKKASDLGNQDANIDIGRIYEEGKGNVKVDYQQAAIYYAKGDIFNNHKAQYRLGKMHYYGKGFKQNYSEALRYFRKASRAKKENIYGSYPSGAAESDNSLAYMYAFGQGVQRNLGLAEASFLKSNEKESTELALRNIAVINKLKQNSCFSNKPFNITSCNKIASALSFDW